MNKLSIKEELIEKFVKVKHRGEIYTPDYLVDIILNQSHYVFGNINKKHVIDNSCGDGQFVVKVVERYVNDYLMKSSNLMKLKNELETYIHAIEIDKCALDLCVKRCNELVSKYKIFGVNWDFINANTLNITQFNNRMDFVVGNPPYVRVHNLRESFDSVKRFAFGNGGMTDLYIVFYEIGLKMLNEKGILCYITPSSFFTSLAGRNLRDYIMHYDLLESVCDLKHFQAFSCTTYTAIVCLNKELKVNHVQYFEFNGENRTPVFIDKLEKKDYLIVGNFYFSNKENLSVLRKILCNYKESNIEVKNGFATLADNVFIKRFEFNSKYIIPTLKASRAKWIMAIYPYDKKGDIISEDELKKDKNLYDYLLKHKQELLNRSREKNADEYWYAFGRSQGIKDTYKDKISINTLIRDIKDLKIVDVPSGSGVYSGLYILKNNYSADEIKSALFNKEFEVFISLLGKYKSGGCYTFSSKDVKAYLNYKLGYGGLLDYEE